MGMVKNFLDANPESGVVYFESESAITKQMVVDRGIDPNRMIIVPVTTVQEFRTNISRNTQSSRSLYATRRRCSQTDVHLS